MQDEGVQARVSLEDDELEVLGVRDTRKDRLKLLLSIHCAAQTHAHLFLYMILVAQIVIARQAAWQLTTQEGLIAGEDLRLEEVVAGKVGARLTKVNHQASPSALDTDHGVSHHLKGIFAALTTRAVSTEFVLELTKPM